VPSSYWPTPQPLELPSSVVTLSSLPEEQELAPAVDDCPLGQVEQLDEPVEAEYSPAPQDSQLLAPVDGW